jgi:hypothetical protein
MGVFEYECPVLHVTDHYVSLAERPATIPCGVPGCKETARYIVSAARTTFHANDRKAIKGQTVNRGGVRT